MVVLPYVHTCNTITIIKMQQTNKCNIPRNFLVSLCSPSLSFPPSHTILPPKLPPPSLSSNCLLAFCHSMLLCIFWSFVLWNLTESTLSFPGSFNYIILRFILFCVCFVFVLCFNNSLFLLPVPQFLFISSIDWHLSCFQSRVVANKAAINTCV